MTPPHTVILVFDTMKTLWPMRYSIKSRKTVISSIHKEQDTVLFFKQGHYMYVIIKLPNFMFPGV
jgi:hypothetical protein